MKKEILELINDWFRSDLDIELKIVPTDKGYVPDKEYLNYLILENDAYYKENGSVRCNGENRDIDMPLGADCAIYDQIDDLCGIYFERDRLIEVLEEIESRGFELT